MADVLARMRQLIGTSAEWAANNLVIGDGEFALERTASTVRIKIGNGATQFSALPYAQIDASIPPEVLTETDGDTRYLQLADTSTNSAANKVPRMDATGKLLYATLPLPPVAFTSVGAADAGKIVGLSVTGKIDSSMLPPSTAFKGVTNMTAALPAGTYVSGDYYINNGAGTVHASWAGIGGTAIVGGEQAIYNGATWALVGGGAFLPLSGGTVNGATTFRTGTSPALTVTGQASNFTGAIPAATGLHVIGSDANVARVQADSFGAGVQFVGRRTNGSMASPSAPVVANALSVFGGTGYNGSTHLTNNSGFYAIFAAEAWTPAANGTYMTWANTPIGTASSVENMRLTDQGLLLLGASAALSTAPYRLQVSGGAALRGLAQNATGYRAIDMCTETDPVDARRASIFFGAIAGASGSHGYLSFYTTNYGVSYGERVYLDHTKLDASVAIRAKGPNFFDVTTSGVNMGLSGNTGHIVMIAAAAPADQKAQDILVGTDGSLVFRFLNDAVNNATNWMTVARSGFTATSITLSARLGIGAAPASPFMLDFGTAGVGQIGGIANIAGYSDTGGYTMWGGRSTMNGGYVQVTGSGFAGMPNRVLIGTAGVNRIDIDGSGNTNFLKGSGSIYIGGLAARFESAEQAVPTASGNFSVPHTNNRPPDSFQVVIRCKIPEGGWSVGEEIPLLADNTDPNRAIQWIANAGNLNVTYVAVAGATTPGIRNTSGALIQVTAANWRMVFRALWL